MLVVGDNDDDAVKDVTTNDALNKNRTKKPIET